MCAYEAAGEQRSRGLRRVAFLTGFMTVALAVAAALHLSGSVTGRTAAYDADSAGVAEVVIGLVLAGAAVALWRVGSRARTSALYALGFSIVGFLFGLSITLSSGHLPDIAFHISGLALLLVGFVALLRVGAPARPEGIRPGHA